MDNKTGKIVTYGERLLYLKPYDPLITSQNGSHFIILQIENIIYPLSQDLWSVTLPGVQRMRRASVHKR